MMGLNIGAHRNPDLEIKRRLPGTNCQLINCRLETLNSSKKANTSHVEWAAVI